MAKDEPCARVHVSGRIVECESMEVARDIHLLGHSQSVLIAPSQVYVLPGCILWNLPKNYLMHFRHILVCIGYVPQYHCPLGMKGGQVVLSFFRMTAKIPSKHYALVHRSDRAQS